MTNELTNERLREMPKIANATGNFLVRDLSAELLVKRQEVARLASSLAAVERQRDELAQRLHDLAKWARVHAKDGERWQFDQLSVWRCVATELRSAASLAAQPQAEPAEGGA